MKEPAYQVIDGIAYYDEPYIVNGVKFAGAHLDCKSIIKGGVLDSANTVCVIAYATAEQYNDKLLDVRYDKYTEDGYGILGSIPSQEVLWI